MEQMNRWLHEVVTGNHICEIFNAGKCVLCLSDWPPKDIPDYCSSLDLIREAELKAIEKVGGDTYTAILGAVVCQDVAVVPAAWYTTDQLRHAIVATAEQRARAIKKCLEEK